MTDHSPSTTDCHYSFRIPPKTARGKMLPGITYTRWLRASGLIVDHARRRDWPDLLDELERLHPHVASHPAALEVLRNSWMYERRNLG